MNRKTMKRRGPVLAAVLAITKRRYLFFACLKHRGGQVCLVVCRQKLVSLCHIEYRCGIMLAFKIVMDVSGSLAPERRAVRPPLLI
jgi:hypothetical protein